VAAIGLACAIGARGARAIDDGNGIGAGIASRRDQTPPTEISDAGGQKVKIRSFRRIVSGSSVADRLLVELCEPDRIVAFTGYGAAHSFFGYQYAGRARVPGNDGIEALVALEPDLFITNSLGDTARLARIREAGIQVFDLGEMRGLESLLASAQAVAILVGHPERGTRFVEGFSRRFDHIAAGIRPDERRRGIYLSLYGNQIFGGSTGTSYHDVLTHAGLIDAAAGHFANWPQYSPEQILILDPEVIVTKPGMRGAICERAPFQKLRACHDGLVVEISGELLDDPGPTMQEAAEQIVAAVYGGSR
jgi:iron complex transport system substrate-binding protein